MIKLGAGLYEAIFAQNLTWAFALLVILERFVAKLTNSKLAGRIAPVILFFSGGLGFVWFFKDLGQNAKGLSDMLWHLPQNYTRMGDQFWWGNSMIVLFITQRGLLFGMPLTLLVLNYLWKIFARDEDEPEAKEVKSEKVKKKKREKAPGPAFSLFRFFPFPVWQAFAVGLLAGTLPLVHVHSLAVLFVVTAVLFVLRPAKWQEWVAFGVGTALIAVPELVWTMAGAATDAGAFFGWRWGWIKAVPTPKATHSCHLAGCRTKSTAVTMNKTAKLWT